MKGFHIRPAARAMAVAAVHTLLVVTLTASLGEAAFAAVATPQASTGRLEQPVKCSLFTPFEKFAQETIYRPVAPFELVPGQDPNGWGFVIEPYLWATGISGTTGVGKLPAVSGRVPAGKILQNLQWGLMARGEVRKGRWGLLADGYYAKLEGGRNLKGYLYQDGSLDISQGLFSLTPAYRFIDDRHGFFDVYAGARYNYIGLNLSLTPSAGAGLLGRSGRETPIVDALRRRLPTSGSDDNSWIDPILGARGQINLTRWLFLAAQADVGGFGAGSQITWNTQATVGFNFTRNVFVEVGYRYMYVDYESSDFLYQVNSYGPFAGLGFKF
jgi:hypothetical protein